MRGSAVSPPLFMPSVLSLDLSPFTDAILLAFFVISRGLVLEYSVLGEFPSLGSVFSYTIFLFHFTKVAIANPFLEAFVWFCRRMT